MNDAQNIHRIGIEHLQGGRIAEACEALEVAVSAAPERADFRVNLGVAYRHAERGTDAVDAFKAALAINPKEPMALTNLGLLWLEGGESSQAVELLTQAVELRPHDKALTINLASGLLAAGRYSETVNVCDKILSADSKVVPALFAKGVAHFRNGDLEEGARTLEQAVLAAPNAADIRLGLFHCYLALGRVAEAEACLAGETQFDTVAEQAAVASALLDLAKGQPDLALNQFGAILENHPEQVDANWFAGVAQFQLGRLEEGWARSEWRWRLPEGQQQVRPFDAPLWQGEPADGRSILLWGEQGLGDEVLFASMVSDMAKDWFVTLEADGRLVPLFRRSFPDIEVIERTWPSDPDLPASSFDLQSPTGSLGHWLRRSYEDFPDRAAYLTYDTEQRDALKSRIQDEAGAGARPVIGLSWFSGKDSTGPARSVPLALWAPVFSQCDATWVDLQPMDLAEERAEAEAAFGCRIHRFEEAEDGGLEGAAALIGACDLVISISNTAAHLAGALGQPTWLLLPKGFGRKWYWLSASDQTTPWYPTARLFNQITPGDWQDVMERVGAALAHDEQG